MRASILRYDAPTPVTDVGTSGESVGPRYALVGRAAERAVLQGWLARTSAPRVGVGFVVGSGGIGKTWFVDGVLRASGHLANSQAVILRVEGARAPRGLSQILRDLLRSARTSGDTEANVEFPLTERSLAALDDLCRDFERELRELAEKYEAVRDVVVDLVPVAAFVFAALGTAATSAGHAELGIPAEVFGELTAKHGDKVVALAIDQIRRLHVFALERGNEKEVKARNEVRRDLHGAIARSLVKDLSDALLEPRTLKFWQARRKRPVVIVFDDWEIVGRQIESWVTGALLPQMKHAGFEATLLVLGRGVPGYESSWRRAHAKMLLEPLTITLKALSDEDTKEYLRVRGIRDEQRVASIAAETNGYPLLLDLLIEDELSDSRGSISSLTQFCNRVTQWMTDEQRAWAEALAFLDEITEEGVRMMLPEVDAKRVFRWFDSEGSLRDSRSATYSMVPAIRSRMLDLARKQSPRRYAEMVERARASEGSVKHD